MELQPLLAGLDRQRGGEAHLQLRTSRGQLVNLILPDGQIDQLDVWGLDRGVRQRLALAERAAAQLDLPAGAATAGEQ